MQLLDDCMNIDCRDSIKRGGYPELNCTPKVEHKTFICISSCSQSDFMSEDCFMCLYGIDKCCTYRGSGGVDCWWKGGFSLPLHQYDETYDLLFSGSRLAAGRRGM